MNQAEDPANLRLFVAIELPETWLAAIEDLQSRLRSRLEKPGKAPLRLRWVRPEGVHLTLKFLGNVAALRLAELQRALQAALPRSPELELRLGSPSFFADPRRGRVRVLWLGLEGDVRALAALAGRIDAACAGLGFEPERRPFAPHLTLARVSEDQILLQPAAEELLRSLSLPQPPPLHVVSVSLMRSHLDRSGARYERLAALPG
jgi:2'-5' RNA ligase